jgi:CHASE2 domain-containing sensor protein
MLRSVGVVLGSYILIGILVVLTDSVLGQALGAKPGQGQPVPALYFVVSLFTAPFYSGIGGYVCARLAARAHWKHVIALVIFGELMGVASTVMFWGQQPVWYAAGLLVLFPVMVLAGGWLALRGRNSEAFGTAAGMGR